MSARVGDLVLIAAEPPERCATCGELRELRDAGDVPGARVCFPCSTPAGRARWLRVLFGDSAGGIVPPVPPELET